MCPEIAAGMKRGSAAPAEARPDAGRVFQSVQATPPTREAPPHPTQGVQDRIMFIINNLADDNFTAKLDELRSIFHAEHSAWLAAYLVGKRVCIEPNYHGLYIRFLFSGLAGSSGMHGVKERLLEWILYETYSAIGVLLEKEKTVTSSEERSVLKNLGTWLGAITLARNVPILRANLAVKELLLEGYDVGRLIVVIPFVCKVVEHGVKAGDCVFSPPNPWTMAVLRVLSELYHYADLKLNLKFEIEVLCKHIKLDVKGLLSIIVQFADAHVYLDIPPTNLLESRPSNKHVANEANQMQKNFERLKIAPSNVTSSSLASPMGPNSYGGTATIPGPRGQQQQPQAPPQQQAPPQEAVSPDDKGAASALPANLAQFVTFSPSLASAFSAAPALKRVIVLALERAVREIINPVVERSVTIAGIATRELVIKDFALEPNEARMRDAAAMMVASLSGSLASVTSREPLRISFIQHVKTLLAQANLEAALPESGVFMVVNDNLELACSLVEKTAAEKAVVDIEESLAVNFDNRKKHREVCAWV